MAQGSITPADASGAGWRLIEEERRRLKGSAPHLLPIGLSDAVLKLERSWDSEWIVAEGRPWFFDGVEKRMYQVDLKNRAFRVFLAHRYGLAQTDSVTRTIVSYLEAYGIKQGAVREVRSFSHYARAEQALYLSRYNGTAWRLDGESVEVVPNGRGVLFLDDEDADPAPDVEVKDHGQLLGALIDDLQYLPETGGGMSPRSQRNLLAIWLHAVAFADLFPAKPLLLVEGEKGSGKTACLQRIQILLTGRSFPLILGQHGEDDFAIQLQHAVPIALLDNIDTSIAWLRDSICAYATSGGWRRRKLYSDAERYDIRPQTFVAIASRNPTTFRRDDVADRCLVVRLERRTVFDTADDLLDSVRQRRAILLGEWLWRLNRVVAYLKTMPTRASAYRLSDVDRIARAVGEASLGLTPAEIEAVLAEAQAERDALTLEDEPLLDLLHGWLELRTNWAREMRLIELYQELGQVAANRAIPFYPGVRVLAARLRNVRSALERHFRVTRRTGHNNTVLYSFCPVTGAEGATAEPEGAEVRP